MLYNQFVTILSNTNWYDDRFKILMTLGTIVKHQSSHLAYKLNPSMHKITNLWKFELNIGRRSGEIIKKKNLVTRSCVLKMFDFETSKSNFEVSKSTSWKITIFSKSTLHQRELISQCFIQSTSPYDSLPLQVRFMLLIILNYYQ